MLQCYYMPFKSSYLGISVQIQMGLIHIQENSLPCTFIYVGFQVVPEIQSIVVYECFSCNSFVLLLKQSFKSWKIVCSQTQRCHMRCI